MPKMRRVYPLGLHRLCEVWEGDQEDKVMSKLPFDTWKCHICREERPDERISVVTKPLVINGQTVGEQNIRYCNDREKCIEGARTFSFVNK